MESFKIYNTERAIRAKSNRINPEDRNEVDFVLTEHDLEYPVDYRESQEDIFPTMAHAAFVVTEGIMLRREKLAADMAQINCLMVIFYPYTTSIIIMLNARQ